MGYAKKKFDGNWENMYNIIVNNKGNNPQVHNYTPVAGSIKELDWEGQGKDAICQSVSDLDNACKQLKNELTINVNKVKKCNGPLFSELDSLKSAIDEYNGYVDEYNSIVAQIRMQQNKKS